MKIIQYPSKDRWNMLCKRSTINEKALEETVENIIDSVATEGDVALMRFAREFDKANLENLEVTEEEFVLASEKIDRELKKAIRLAKNNIESFHNAQKEKKKVVKTTPGVSCWRKSVAIQKVGLYIPGGSAPLFSTILMLAIPAKIAGCEEIILCTPPNKNGKIDPTIAYTASLVGVDKIYKVGGAQAIAAMSIGTETIPSVYKILGPGNQYVTKAKELVQKKGVAIDMPAGPSEVLVIADETSNPSFVASDLLSQAEHGEDSQVVLVVNALSIANEVAIELEKQMLKLPRKDTAQKALENSFSIVLNSLEEAMDFSNTYAPEHLIIASDNFDIYMDKVVNAGSVFLGNYSCESAGDYASGTNHTLPTNGYAKNYSGVSLDSFVKKITFQEVTKEGLKRIGNAIEVMAEAEGLIAHKNAVSIRMQMLEEEPNEKVQEINTQNA